MFTNTALHQSEESSRGRALPAPTHPRGGSLALRWPSHPRVGVGQLPEGTTQVRGVLWLLRAKMLNALLWVAPESEFSIYHL